MNRLTCAWCSLLLLLDQPHYQHQLTLCFSVRYLRYLPADSHREHEPEADVPHSIYVQLSYIGLIVYGGLNRN
jgi:hypothetical protein